MIDGKILTHVVHAAFDVEQELASCCYPVQPLPISMHR